MRKNRKEIQCQRKETINRTIELIVLFESKGWQFLIEIIKKLPQNTTSDISKKNYHSIFLQNATMLFFCFLRANPND